MSEPLEEGRFVLLEHDWNGVHWDFMIEAGGQLRTWAVDAPIVPGQELPARQLPDHRLVYLTYEGPISGGRGNVRRLDEGTYRIIEWCPDRFRLFVRGAQLVGEVGLYRSGSGSTGSTTWKFRLGKVD